MTAIPPGIKSARLRAAILKHYQELTPYVPIVPTDILSKEGGLSQEGVIKLDGNENPYGPAPRALAALQQYDAYHIYPDPSQRELRLGLAGYLGVAVEEIAVGSGSDELIDLLARLLVEPGDAILTCSPTFGMYPFTTQVVGGRVVDVPRKADFTLDMEPLLEAAKQPNSKLIFLASPNNPTGNPLRPDELDALLDTGILVVVDEAYQEFSAAPSYAPLVREHENLVVLRTFSKWAGLAGLRVGYGVLTPALVALIDLIKPPYNVNVAGLVAAQVSLEERDLLLKRVGLMVQERGRMFQALQGISYLEPIPSEANFLLCKVDGRDAAALKNGLERRGIFIKRVDSPYLPNAIRISTGKPEHTDAVLAALKEL